jgi:maltose O-acetyltransferase
MLKFFYKIFFSILIKFSFYGKDGDKIRGKIWNIQIKNSGKNFKVGEGVLIYSPEKLAIGNNVYLGFCSYLGNGTISLDDNVVIGTHVSIAPSNHQRVDNNYRFSESLYDPISIGRGTWVCSHVVILAGSKIGSGCVVAAGAVVQGNFPDNCLITGFPANIKKFYK